MVSILWKDGKRYLVDNKGNMIQIGTIMVETKSHDNKKR
jgi:hypothetical protein